MIKLKKRFLVIVIPAIMAFTLIFIWAYNYYKTLKQPVIPVLSSIPEDALFFAQFNNISNFWEKLSNNASWNNISKIEYFDEINNQIKYTDSLIANNEKLKTIVNEGNPVISFHYLDDEIRTLFLCNLPPDFDIYDLKHLLGKNSNLSTNINKTDKLNILFINRKGLQKTYFAGIYKGVFIGSFSEKLINKAVQKINSENIEENNDIKTLKLTAGKKVDANIFINYKNFSQFLKSIFIKDFPLNFDNLNNLGNWAELDLLVKDSSFLFNGYSQLKKDSYSYLELFSSMKPQTSQLADFIPNNAIGFVSFNFDDFATYFAQYKKNLKKYPVKSDLEKTINSLNSNGIVDNFIEWTGNEFGVVLLPSNNSFETFVVCKKNELSNADSCLQALAAKSQNISNLKDRKFQKNKIIYPNLLRNLFGDFCSSSPETYYEITDEFVVFAKSENALQIFKNSYISEDVLSKTDNYKNFITNTPAQSNVFIYFNLTNSFNLIYQNLINKYRENFKTNFPVLSNFNQFALQISSEEQKWYTTLSFDFKTNISSDNINTTENLVPGYNTELKSKIYSKPYIVKNTTSNENNIIVFDEMNICYFIDKSGKIIWQKNIDGKVLSKVWEVDYYNNGKIQFLFNTEKTLYLIDANGKDVEKYPLRLTESASSGLCLIDYEKKKNYRIIIPTINKKLLYLSLSGKAVTDFTSPVFKDIVNQPVQHIIFDNKDNIIVTENSGKVNILDRKGKQRLVLKTSFSKSPDNIFYYDGKYLITADNDGKIIYISNNGKIESKSFLSLSTKPLFVYEDFNNDGKKDFIFLDEKSLNVFNKSGKNIFNYKFDEKIERDIVINSSAKRGNLFAICGKESNRIYVFNKSGLIDESIAFKSEIMPSFARFYDNQINLVGIVGNKVTVYSFE
jgi:hypothetical protein